MYIRVVSRIGVEYDGDKLQRDLHIEGPSLLKKQAALAAEEGRRLIEPKAVYTCLKVVGVEGGQVTLENGAVLRGAVLADRLRCGQEVAPYVVTIGPELENRVSQLSKSNIVQAFLLDTIGSHAVRIAKKKIELLVAEELGVGIFDFGPGEATGELFGLEQQTVLFSILEPGKNIGVNLMSSCMMTPQKSASGVFAVSDREYIACRYCSRRCEVRKAAFRRQYSRYEDDNARAEQGS